jgi:hypothetical protein
MLEYLIVGNLIALFIWLVIGSVKDIFYMWHEGIVLRDERREQI